MESLETKTIRGISGMNFLIPSYQRGYRWSAQQISDMLSDIFEFAQNDKCEIDDFYCLQPIVIKKRINNEKVESFYREIQNIPKGSTDFFEQVENILQSMSEWEVVDGQQRLTSIFLILKYLEVENIFGLDYETRGKTSNVVSSKDFLNNINTNKYNANIADTIDFHHFYTAFYSIKSWFENRTKENPGKDVKSSMRDILLDYVRVIWYEIDSPKPIEVFTRLNVGKISLTNAELIKALFLNRSNFGGIIGEDLEARQNEIAAQWDQVESSLQDDEFWLMLNPYKEVERPTRIDFIFDIIYERNILNIDQSTCGEDEYKTFRYFESFFKNKKKTAIKECWEEVLNIYDAAKEWFDDITIYHYVGFLIECHQDDFKELYRLWLESVDKNVFVNKLVEEIKKCISKSYDSSIGVANTVYTDGHFGSKTKCKPLLLLFNIQSIIVQNNELKSHKEYNAGITYKFPFHLYKKENWDIEHIDSNTTEDSESWLKNLFIGNGITHDQKEKIKGILTEAATKQEDEKNVYLANSTQEVVKEIGYDSVTPWDKPEEDKNKIWNFTLLDCHTNRSYGNSMFSYKRMIISGKDRGIKYIVDDNLNVHPDNDEIRELIELRSKKKLTGEEKKRFEKLTVYSTMAFIPPCTKNVFEKYYSPSPKDLISWSKDDAKHYLESITLLLSKFIG